MSRLSFTKCLFLVLQLKCSQGQKGLWHTEDGKFSSQSGPLQDSTAVAEAATQSWEQRQLQVGAA